MSWRTNYRSAPGGERPSPPHGAAWGAKRAGEANRVLPEGHKSAEPAKAGREGTSDPENGPASESAKERETEPMAEAPSSGTSPTRKWVRQSKDLWSADTRLMGARQGRRENRGQQPGKPARPGCRNPHGVKLAPKADEERRWNLGTRPRCRLLRGRMAEATGDRAKRRRSLRSSPRTGKPSTWRRRAVDTPCKQEMDFCPTR